MPPFAFEGTNHAPDPLRNIVLASCVAGAACSRRSDRPALHIDGHSRGHLSGRLALQGSEVPLLAEPAARVAILTPSSASLPAGVAAAKVDYIRAARDGQLDLAAALAELQARFGVRTLLCEGGPRLNAQLLGAGLVDELFLSLSPLLAGGDFDGNPAHPNPAHPEALRILAGPSLSPPVALELRGVLEHDSGLFLRYGVRSSAPAERVSRETMPSSSLAR